MRDTSKDTGALMPSKERESKGERDIEVGSDKYIENERYQ